MKVEISNDELAYLSSLLKEAGGRAPKELAKRFKYLARRLEPPKEDIRLSLKNLAFLLVFLENSLKVLSSKDDPLAKAEVEVLTSFLTKVKEIPS